MFWRRNARDKPEPPADTTDEEITRTSESSTEPFEIESGASRPATIIRLAAELERRGKKVVELFKEVESPRGRGLIPLYLQEDDRDLFVELETNSWDEKSVEKVIKTAALLRDSEYKDARLELFSAHPAPEPVSFLLHRSQAALFQLYLSHIEPSNPESLAETFREAAARYWEVDLDYTVESLPLTEELLSATLTGGKNEKEKAPVLDVLVQGLGCYLGEVIRRNTPKGGYWREADEWGERFIIEIQSLNLDPVGMSRAFLSEENDDSLAYYARYMLEEVADG